MVPIPMRAASLVGSLVVSLIVAASLAAPTASFAGTVAIGDLRDPRPSAWVVDQAGVLDDAAEQSLNTSLTALHAEVGPEIAVVTVSDVSGTPKAFATALFNTWKLGHDVRNDGVLVLLVVGQRRLEIETGDGMQAQLTAAWLSELQRTEMVPSFKRGDLGGGLVAGTAGLIARLRRPPGEQDAPDAPGAYRSDGELAAQPAGARSALGTQPSGSGGSGDSVPNSPAGLSTGLKLLIGAAALAIVIGGIVLLKRRRSRKCRTCGIQRSALDEEADDAHLTPGQRAEEKVGSVDHTILFCPTCQTFEHRSRNIFFSRRSTCAGCTQRTALTETTVVRSPTYESSGTARVDIKCSFCPHKSSSTHSLARLTRSTSSSSSSSGSSRSSYGSSSSSSSSSSSRSSSSSSSSSSGGGRSSGGGSGSSW